MSSMNRRNRSPNDVLAVLDVGTSKVTCLIAERGQVPLDLAAPAATDPDGRWSPAAPALPARVLGFGHQRSGGIKAGTVVDLTAAEQCIRATIAQAEQMAGLEVSHVVLSVACGRLQSLNFRANARLGKYPLNDADIGRVMAAGQAYAERDARRLVHLNRINWRLDGQPHIREPRGMRGNLLEADLHAVTADEAPLRNLVIAVERAYVKVSSLVAAPFASGIAVTTPEERRFGVTVLDVGAGLTSLAYFGEGHLLNVDAVTIGGTQITYDIARAMTISLAEAERIKTLCGTLVAAPSDEYETLAYAQANGIGAERHATRGSLRRLLRPRVEQMFETLKGRIDANRFAPHASGRIVLTGGSVQFAGCAELAAQVLGRPVRIGAPDAMGLPPVLAQPPFATVAGILRSLFVPGACVLSESRPGADGTSEGYLGQVGSWLRQSF